MKLRPSPLNIAPGATTSRSCGIALIITLLMLSIITFLAVAFLVMTRRDTSSKNATLDVSTAQAMSDAALARAQSEIIARMTAQTDILAYDYMVSSNYITPGGYVANLGYVNSNNVNYDFQGSANGLAQSAWPATQSAGNMKDWAQNIANLFFDPRPPVFVYTNTDPTRPATDFRYYVDLNRDGAFEGSSFRSVDKADNNTTLPVAPNTSGQQGEPEWIGVLADPTHAHSRTNLFIGRYAYMVLPIGKTLDLNYIHNNSQTNFNGATAGRDEFVRDQGVGSWELNLGGYLRELNTNLYGENPLVAPVNRYLYRLPNVSGRIASFNQGLCFDDARSFLTNRFTGEGFAQSLFGVFGLGLTGQFQRDGIDEYATSPITNLDGPFDFTTSDPEASVLGITSQPWPGSYTSHMFYDMQDVFNPTMTSANFTNRLGLAGGSTGWPFYFRDPYRIQYDRYTYQRMLASIGTGSQPEYGVYVYADGVTNLPGSAPSLLMTKMNLNYDNWPQMEQGPYALMPTNPVPWTDPLKFFTNAAELLLRTQDFPVTNTTVNIFQFCHFGLSSMGTLYPIYTPTNGTYRYTSQLHRMLQLAANLYDENHNTNTFISGIVNGSNIYSYYPSVFRPVFRQSNGCLFITSYKLVTPQVAPQQLGNPWRRLTDLNIGPNDNVYGVPWVIGAVKGIPSFNEISSSSCFTMTRKLNLVRRGPKIIPYQTNQFYEMSLSNRFGMDAWNSYTNAFIHHNGVDIHATNFMTIILTNNASWGMVSNLVLFTNSSLVAWPAWDNTKANSSFITPLLNDTIELPLAKYSDKTPGFYPLGGSTIPMYDSNILSVHNWHVIVTNTLVYVLQDHITGNILDFVNLGSLGTSFSISQEISNNILANVLPGAKLPGPSWFYVWDQRGGTDAIGSPPSVGVSQQVRIGEGAFSPSDWPVAKTDPNVTQFASFLDGQSDTTNLTVDDYFQPSVVVVLTNNWQANDPLVHYLPEDLSGSSGSASPGDYPPAVFAQSPPPQPLSSNTGLGQVNWRYDPWPNPGRDKVIAKNERPIHQNQGNEIDSDVLFKDPQITQSDDWRFPTNRFPSIGWLGRVHRGTPWQTVYLKADSDYGAHLAAWGKELGIGDAANSLPGEITTAAPDWLTISTNPIAAFRALAAYPTNDWRLLDLFTTAPNDNALRGTLSVNQTNSAAWHALLDGVVVLTNGPEGLFGMPIDPTRPYLQYSNAVAYILDSTNAFPLPGATQVTTNYGINAYRANQVNGLFHHIGDILQAPTLTVASPYIDFSVADNIPRDEVVERIPQQVASLLKVGEPQFVIYAWGQSLRPQALYNPLVGSANLFKICTNYSITGEFLTRTVCHLDLTKSDRFGTNAHIQIDSFNILPAAQ